MKEQEISLNIEQQALEIFYIDYLSDNKSTQHGSHQSRAKLTVILGFVFFS